MWQDFDPQHTDYTPKQTRTKKATIKPWKNITKGE